MKFLPTPAPATQLLTDLLCTPVSMRSDRFFALVRDLAAGVFDRRDPLATFATATPREHVLRSALSPRADDTTDTTDPTDPETVVYPWEEPIYTVQNGIAVIEVTGALVKGYDACTCWYYGVMSTDRLQQAIAELAARNDVPCVILKLNTPGGMSTGMPETADALVALGQSRLLIAYTSDLAASNGMRLAVACNQFYPTPSAIVGCIGTYVAMYDYTDYLKQLGIKLDLFRDGALKGIGIMGKTLTDKERAFLQADVMECGRVFKDFVSARRGGVDEALMQGQWFTGSAAAELGLADGTVGGFPEVMLTAQRAIVSLLASAVI